MAYQLRALQSVVEVMDGYGFAGPRRRLPHCHPMGPDGEEIPDPYGMDHSKMMNLNWEYNGIMVLHTSIVLKSDAQFWACMVCTFLWGMVSSLVMQYCKVSKHATKLYGITIFIHYFNMLIVMCYNMPILIALSLGHGVGFCAIMTMAEMAKRGEGGSGVLWRNLVSAKDLKGQTGAITDKTDEEKMDVPGDDMPCCSAPTGGD